MKLMLPSLDKVSLILKGSPPIIVFILYDKLIKKELYPRFNVFPEVKKKESFLVLEFESWLGHDDFILDIINSGRFILVNKNSDKRGWYSE